MKTPPHTSSEAPAHRSDFVVIQEHDDVASRKVGLVLAGGALATIGSVVIAGWILSATLARLPPHETTSGGVAPAEIDGVHQTLIERDRHGWRLREAQRRSLEGYRWIDRAHGAAEIPVERAMEIVAGEGADGTGPR
jgi:hypothetical protein